jgi:hypothetical protein
VLFSSRVNQHRRRRLAYGPRINPAAELFFERLAACHRTARSYIDATAPIDGGVATSLSTFDAAVWGHVHCVCLGYLFRGVQCSDGGMRKPPREQALAERVSVD